MNLQQKTRLLELEFENVGLHDPTRRLKPGVAAMAARANVDQFTWPEAGSPPVGIGGQTATEYVTWLRSHRPEDFEPTTTI